MKYTLLAFAVCLTMQAFPQTAQATVVDCSTATKADCVAKVQQAGGTDGKSFCSDPRETMAAFPYKKLYIACPGASPSTVAQAKQLDMPPKAGAQTCIQYRNYITCAKSEDEFTARKLEIDKEYADKAEQLASEQAASEQAARDEAADDGFKLPRCGSEQGKVTLANVIGTDLRMLLEVRTTDSNAKQRWCYAYFIAPYPGLGGSFREVVYTLEWIDEVAGRYWLQVRTEQRIMPRCTAAVRTTLPSHPICQPTARR